MQSSRYSCQIVIKLEFYRQTSENSSNAKFHKKNIPVGAGGVSCADRQTDMAQLITAFRNFANAPKIVRGCGEPAD
jgi:hypothetical protein